jgi:6,7-dimethyl-8-ribityllumazine synthase
MTFEGQLSASGLRFCIVVGRFNSFITDRLLAGAMDALARAGGDTQNVDIVKVPGSWEMPVAVRELAKENRYDAIICLGAVIRGETAHFDLVASEAARGIAEVARSTGVPTIFEVLAADTLALAEGRAGGEHGNRGWDAALAVLEMASLVSALGEEDG